MKIAIDCRALRKKPVGVTNFLIGVINHLAIYRKEWTLYLLSNENFNSEASKRLRISNNTIVVIDPLVIFPRISTLWYFFKLPFILRKLRPNCFYSPIPNLPLFIPAHIKTVVTVHDMVYKLFPETMSFENRLVNFFVHNKSLRQADKLWAISEYTKGEVERFYPKRRSSDILVGTAVESDIYRPLRLTPEEQEKVLRRYGIQRSFILTVGTIEPRKNLRFLLSLAEVLTSKNFQIVIVGAKGWGSVGLNPPAGKAGSFDPVKFLGFVPDEELIALYNLAAAYVSTSLNEGFCLPLLEAMHCGCPVVAAHNSGMIEVASLAGETVKDWDVNVWAKTIERTASARAHYAARGFIRAQQYQWDSLIIRVSNYIEDNP